MLGIADDTTEVIVDEPRFPISEILPTEEEYEHALNFRVYDDDTLERNRLWRIRIGRIMDPVYRLEIWLATKFHEFRSLVNELLLIAEEEIKEGL